MMQCSHERLFLALGFELFAVKDDKFMNMFVAPGAVDAIQNERESLLKHQKTFVLFKRVQKHLINPVMKTLCFFHGHEWWTRISPKPWAKI